MNTSFFYGLEGYVGISIIPMAAHRCIMDLSPARNAQIAGSFVLSLPWKKRQFRVILPTKHHWLSRCRSDGFLDHHQWWFVIFYLGGGFKDFLFSPPKLGKIPNLTNIFQLGWNHQLVICNIYPPRPMIFCKEKAMNRKKPRMRSFCILIPKNSGELSKEIHHVFSHSLGRHEFLGGETS